MEKGEWDKEKVQSPNLPQFFHYWFMFLIISFMIA
jgi:hypothetical protein